MTSRTFYRRASMAQVAAQAAASGLAHDNSLRAEAVSLPDCLFGQTFLERWPLRELPNGVHWRDATYVSYSPRVFTIANARVHSTAGIVCAGAFVIAETLAQTSPEDHGYTSDGDGIWLDDTETALGGTHISVLATGAPGNYFHTLIDGMGRLSAVSGPILDAADGVIAAADRSLPAYWLLDRVAALSAWQWTTVQPGRSVRVERLVFAAPHSQENDFHPALADRFDSLATWANDRPGFPTAIYVDRRGSQLRPLQNEEDLVAALRPLGVLPVPLERTPPASQIALFRNARLIVAPHGAGLANLVFARPGACKVLELQVDAYCQWLFRRLAALKRLPYDCVLGRAELPWHGMDLVHTTRWQVSIPHVVAAVQSLLAAP